MISTLSFGMQPHQSQEVCKQVHSLLQQFTIIEQVHIGEVLPRYADLPDARKHIINNNKPTLVQWQKACNTNIPLKNQSWSDTKLKTKQALWLLREINQRLSNNSNE
jgi:hypothetical protein